MVDFNYQTLRMETEERVATLTIDYPPVNSITESVLMDLEDAFGKLESRDDIRVVIITAKGPRAFVAGADVNVLSRKDAASITAFLTRIHNTFNTIELFPKPVICAINSHAVGNGCELAMVSDIRIANADATFIFPECKFGVVSAGGTTLRLPRLIPKGRALYYLFTGNEMRAAEALDLGFVDFVTPAEEVLPFARQMARDISANAPTTVSVIKQLVRQGQDLHLKAALEKELQNSIESCQTDDFLEGMTAYLEKRSPVFTGG